MNISVSLSQLEMRELSVDSIKSYLMVSDFDKMVKVLGFKKYS